MSKIYIETYYDNGKKQLLGSDGTLVLKGSNINKGFEDQENRLKSLLGIKSFLQGDVVLKATDASGKVIQEKNIKLEKKMAKGGGVEVKMKDWYTKNYPTDDLGEEINDTATFEDLWNSLNKRIDVYEVIGVGDSVVRERLFEQLSKIKNVDYQFVYHKWLDTDGMISDEELKAMYPLKTTYAKGGEIKIPTSRIQKKLIGKNITYSYPSHKNYPTEEWVISDVKYAKNGATQLFDYRIYLENNPNTVIIMSKSEMNNLYKNGIATLHYMAEGSEIKIKEENKDTYAKGGEVVSELKGEREHNPKMKMTDAQINDLVADIDSVSNYAKGGSISDDTPKVYVADLSAYNSGTLQGEWIDLTDYNDGSEVMDKIAELLESWSTEDEEKEEYAIHDYENFASSMYYESMGEDDFDKIIKAHRIAEEKGLPIEVITQIEADYSPDDLEEWIDENYEGEFDSDTDLAYHFVDMVGGVENVGNSDYYFDYGALGRDLAISDYTEMDGHYFRNNYAKGGLIIDLKKYFKSSMYFEGGLSFLNW